MPPGRNWRVLLLDTEPAQLEPLAAALARRLGDRAVERLCTARELTARLRSGLPYDLVIVFVDSRQARDPGLAALRRVRREDASVALVAVATQGDVRAAATAVAAGASDFLVVSGQLDARVDTLLAKVGHVLELVEQNRALDEQNRLLREASRAAYRIVGESPQVRALLAHVERVARIPRPVMILGERGTGKELVARAIHDGAGDGKRPFVAVNCAAFADDLLETELFGHERGAFTGADRTTRGKFEQAEGGTLFLDEIGNMSLSFQRKILRAVEYGSFTRVGGRQELGCSARILTATNVRLEERMERGEFLRDLYDRLAFDIVEVPPLRERAGDIRVLARHFLERFMAEIPALGGKRLAPAAMAALERYPFPGNVRELKNIVERAAYRDTTNEITPEDIGLLPSHPTAALAGGGFYTQLAVFEASLLERALAEAGGNQAAAARTLGMTYDQFRHFARKHKLV